MDNALWGDASFSWPFGLAVTISLIGIVLTVLLSIRIAAQWLHHSHSRVFRRKGVPVSRLQGELSGDHKNVEDPPQAAMPLNETAQDQTAIAIRDLNREPFTVSIAAAE